ncbi:MAG TPA: hypothetical protein ACFYDZ_08375 [Candidatus Brocadiaceae bacterium]
MYTAITIPKPIGAGPLTTAINNAVPPGREIVAVSVDGNNLIIVYK